MDISTVYIEISIVSSGLFKVGNIQKINQSYMFSRSNKEIKVSILTNFFTFLYSKTRKLRAIILKIEIVQIFCGYFLSTFILAARAVNSLF